MISKNIIFLFSFILTIGCGVMNNPEENKKVSQVSTESMLSTDANKAFIDSIGDMNFIVDNPDMTHTPAYKIFETKISMDNFLKDLNTTAQTLPEGDLQIVTNWINSMKNANTNYETQNLLFYPILQSQDCGIEDSITTNINNSINITLKPTKNSCEEAHIYYALVYQISKEIENISIKAFDKESITILNRAIF